MFKLRSFAIPALVAVAAVGMAQAAATTGQAPATYSMKRVPKVDDVLKMRMTGEVSVAGQQVSITTLITEKVTKIDANGDYTIESSQTEGKIKFGGQEMAMPSQPASTTKYNANGDVLEIKGDKPTEANEYRLANLSNIHTPDAPVAEGGTWTYTAKADSKTGAVAYTATYKIIGTEKIGSHDSVKLTATIKEAEGAEPASSENTVWLDPQTYDAVKVESNWTNAPIPGAPGPVSGKITLIRED